ncbi:MAG TPA: class I SAM-dependent methyltransferase [Thermoanaerobaculia bacterium]|nr:class I SAM-dependent methyltransferase [Thermoanaerobaculia bacterium]
MPDQETAHLRRWRDLWSDAYAQGTQGSPPGDPSLNTAGWTSSYTGMAIRDAEMKEWVERTVERLLDPLPSRVLEIGCGTGMLLLRMARHAEYVGIDFSDKALAYVQSRVEAEGLKNVTLIRSTADDLSAVEGAFDLVVLNSVVQYFPSLEYFLRVVNGAIGRLTPDGRLFLGDLRSLPLLEAFHASVQAQQADDDVSEDDLRARVRAAVRQERELVIHPALFASASKLFPGVRRAEIQLKRGRARNEMTRFRYDAVLHLSDSVPGPPARQLKWGNPDAVPAKLRKLLAAEAPSAITVLGVPNARLTRPGVDPEDFWALEKDLPYRVRIGWSEGAEDGSYDVRLRHKESGGGKTVVMQEIDSAQWANRPLGEG